jgi:hypothetical protein
VVQQELLQAVAVQALMVLMVQQELPIQAGAVETTPTAVAE